MISVVIAAYNGEEYIGEQLNSILPQLGETDEVIISDDNPSGKTKNVVDTFIKKDSRIKYINGPGKGVIKNFENAIKHASGDIIFLCDQDDVWKQTKVQTVLNSFDKDTVLVMHDAAVTDSNLNVTAPSFFAVHGTNKGFIRNFIRNSYMGCCMAFSSSLKEHILPFPEKIPMHDQWIGLIAQKKGKIKFIDEQLIFYRRSSSSLTGGATTLAQKLGWRFNLARALIIPR